MNPVEGLGRAWHWSVRKILGLWVRVSIKPEDAAAAIAARPRPVCYVLERESTTDLAVLSNVCMQLNLPRPGRRAHFELIVPKGLLGRRAVRAPRILVQLVAAAAADPRFDVDLVPVAIFWGRAPHKEASLWRLFFAEDWVLVGRFRKILGVLVNGRNTLVHFGDPVRLRDAMQDGLDEQRSVRRLLRTLRSILRAQRASTIGPDLSHRRTLVAQLLKTADVRNAVRREMQAHGSSRRAALICGAQVRRGDRRELFAGLRQIHGGMLGWLWNRVFDGVKFEHADQLNDIGDGAEIIYVPCHRSHMDYLLLSYVIYRKGFAVPHVAAGINLNLPVIGRYSAQGRRIFSAPQLQGRRAVRGGVRQIPRLDDGARASASSTSSRADAAAPDGCCRRAPACCR